MPKHITPNNLKTINGQSLFGTGDIVIEGGTTTPPATLQSIEIITGGTTLNEGTSAPYYANGTYSDGSVKDVSTLGVWSASEGAFSGNRLLIPANNVVNDTREVEISITVDGITSSKFVTCFDTTVPPEVTPGKYAVASGNWDSPSTWNNNEVPLPTDEVEIKNGYTVTYNLSDYTHQNYIWIKENSTLKFNPAASATLKMDNKSIIVEGTLEFMPASAAVVHLIQFLNINEDNYQGDGMRYFDNGAAGVPIYTTDPGIWVDHMGMMHVMATSKTCWTNLAGSALTGATTITVNDATGWQVGDALVIVPTRKPDNGMASYNKTLGKTVDSFEPEFERRTIAAISGNTITLGAYEGGAVALEYDHLQVTASFANSYYPIGQTSKTWTAEVLNLSRNVKVYGTESGRSHIHFAHFMMAQMVDGLEGRWLGPRKLQPELDPKNSRLTYIKAFVRGRYGLHFHHAEDGSKGSMIKNCSIYDCNNHCYVPHGSHGMTFDNCIAFRFMEEAFWWDKLDKKIDPATGEPYYKLDANGNKVYYKFANVTHEVTCINSVFACAIDTCIAFGCNAVLLGMGDRNTFNDNVVVYGHTGNIDTSGGIVWGEENEGVWIFEGNMGHSMVSYKWVWQNTSMNHTIERTDCYNCHYAVNHGAYNNMYTYIDGYCWNAPIRISASAGYGPVGARFQNYAVDAGGYVSCIELHDSPIEEPRWANTIVNCVFRNFSVGAVRLFTKKVDAIITNSSGAYVNTKNFKRMKMVDVIDCDAGGGVEAYMDEYTDAGGAVYKMFPASRIRVQSLSGSHYQILMPGDRWVDGMLPPDPARTPVTTTLTSKFSTSVWGRGRGLKGEYFWGQNFEELLFTRPDHILQWLNWKVISSKAYLFPTGVDYTFFEREKVWEWPYYVSSDAIEMSVRWTGYIEAQYTETYNFYVNTGGAFRIWINDVLYHDQWASEVFDTSDETSSSDRTVTCPAYNMQAGVKYKIVIEHKESAGWRGFRLRWKCPSMEVRDLVPLTQQYAPNHPDIVA